MAKSRVYTGFLPPKKLKLSIEEKKANKKERAA